MKTVVAETVMLGREAFETLGEVEVIPDRQIEAHHLKDADILIIRSKTKVTSALLENTNVRFVGTATAGFEHLDTDALAARGIAWAHAPGCNAESVAEYITAALLHLHTEHGIELRHRTLGIIGVGQVGSRVAAKAEALGLRVLLNDPPRAAREPEQIFHPLEEVLADSDIITLHVPLVHEKPWPTLRMANACFFEKMKHGAIFINASRGKTTDGDALLHAKEHGLVEHAVLDVWDPEPAFRNELMEIATLGTPHIAGHSLEGKLNGTVALYREACHFLETAATWDSAPLLPRPDVPDLSLDAGNRTDEAVLAEAVKTVYDIMTDDAALRAAAVPGKTERAKNFDRLRAKYRVRREFSNTQITLSGDRPELVTRLKALGFEVATS